MEDIHCWQTKFVPCVYSDRLLAKLSELNRNALNKVDITEVKKAIYYAKKYHGDQKRQSGEPYYSHPLEVAHMVSDYLFRTDIIVTSILHDTIEDTELTFSMIQKIFGKNVATQVMDLTRIKEDGKKISSAALIESLLSAKKYDMLLIKQFDRLHNLQTIEAKSAEKIQKIIEETAKQFIGLSVFLETMDVEKVLIKICLKYLNVTHWPQNQQEFSYLQENSPLFFPVQ